MKSQRLQRTCFLRGSSDDATRDTRDVIDQQCSRHLKMLGLWNDNYPWTSVVNVLQAMPVRKREELRHLVDGTLA